MFKFSCEEDTPAEKLPDQIDDEVKEERYNKIMSLQHEIASQKAAEQVGKTIEVVTEGYDYDRFMYYGRSYMDSPDIDPVVYFACEREVNIGEFCQVNILDSDNYDLIGVVK